MLLRDLWAMFSSYFTSSTHLRSQATNTTEVIEEEENSATRDHTRLSSAPETAHPATTIEPVPELPFGGMDSFDEGDQSDAETVHSASSGTSFQSATSQPRSRVSGDSVPQSSLGNVQDNSHTTETKNLDLVHQINGMYRILDLVREPGSDGLGTSHSSPSSARQLSKATVDKIVISQESLGKFMNAIKPRAYTSMTKINFAALDTVMVKPQGLYGSRSEISRFLQDIGAVDSSTYEMSNFSVIDLLLTSIIRADVLRQCRDDATMCDGRTLRSGLYMLRRSDQSLVYVIYWPEDTTWDDDASHSVQKNRVTFMR